MNAEPERNYRFESAQILLGTSRLLPEKKHLEAMQSVILAQDAAIRELQRTLMEVIANAEMVEQQLDEVMSLIEGVGGTMRES